MDQEKSMNEEGQRERSTSYDQGQVSDEAVDVEDMIFVDNDENQITTTFVDVDNDNEDKGIEKENEDGNDEVLHEGTQISEGFHDVGSVSSPLLSLHFHDMDLDKLQNDKDESDVMITNNSNSSRNDHDKDNSNSTSSSSNNDSRYDEDKDDKVINDSINNEKIQIDLESVNPTIIINNDNNSNNGNNESSEGSNLNEVGNAKDMQSQLQDPIEKNDDELYHQTISDDVDVINVDPVHDAVESKIKNDKSEFKVEASFDSDVTSAYPNKESNNEPISNLLDDSSKQIDPFIKVENRMSDNQEEIVVDVFNNLMEKESQEVNVTGKDESQNIEVDNNDDGTVKIEVGVKHEQEIQDLQIRNDQQLKEIQRLEGLLIEANEIIKSQHDKISEISADNQKILENFCSIQAERENLIEQQKEMANQIKKDQEIQSEMKLNANNLEKKITSLLEKNQNIESVYEKELAYEQKRNQELQQEVQKQQQKLQIEGARIKNEQDLLLQKEKQKVEDLMRKISELDSENALLRHMNAERNSSIVVMSKLLDEKDIMLEQRNEELLLQKETQTMIAAKNSKINELLTINTKIEKENKALVEQCNQMNEYFQRMGHNPQIFQFDQQTSKDQTFVMMLQEEIKKLEEELRRRPTQAHFQTEIWKLEEENSKLKHMLKQIDQSPTPINELKRKILILQQENKKLNGINASLDEKLRIATISSAEKSRSHIVLENERKRSEMLIKESQEMRDKYSETIQALKRDVDLYKSNYQKLDAKHKKLQNEMDKNQQWLSQYKEKSIESGRKMDALKRETKAAIDSNRLDKERLMKEIIELKKKYNDLIKTRGNTQTTMTSQRQSPQREDAEAKYGHVKDLYIKVKYYLDEYQASMQKISNAIYKPLSSASSSSILSLASSSSAAKAIPSGDDLTEVKGCIQLLCTVLEEPEIIQEAKIYIQSARRCQESIDNCIHIIDIAKRECERVSKLSL